VGIVEIQPALWLQPFEAVRVEPAPPGQQLNVPLAAQVAGLDQCEMRQVAAAFQRMPAFEKPRAGDGRQLFAEQADGIGGNRFWTRITQCHIHVGGFHVDRSVAGVDTDVNVRVFILERFEPGNQPHRRKRGPGGDSDAFSPGAAPDHAHRVVQPLQRRHHRAQQLRAGAGQFDSTRVTQEKGDTDLFFHRLDLAADRALRQRQFFGCSAKVELPRYRFKRAQVAGRNRAGAQIVFGVLHGSPRRRGVV